MFRWHGSMVDLSHHKAEIWGMVVMGTFGHTFRKNYFFKLINNGFSIRIMNCDRVNITYPWFAINPCVPIH